PGSFSCDGRVRRALRAARGRVPTCREARGGRRAQVIRRRRRPDGPAYEAYRDDQKHAAEVTRRELGVRLQVQSQSWSSSEIFGTAEETVASCLRSLARKQQRWRFRSGRRRYASLCRLFGGVRSDSERRQNPNNKASALWIMGGSMHKFMVSAFVAALVVSSFAFSPAARAASVEQVVAACDK